MDWNPKVLREGGKRDLSFYSSNLFRCSAPVLPSISLWYFHLYKEVALSPTTPMWRHFFPLMWCQVVCGEQRNKKKKCRIFCTWGQKCTLRPKVIIQEDGLAGFSGKCSESLSGVAHRDRENTWGKNRDHTCHGQWESVEVSPLCKYYCSPSLMSPSDRAHLSSSQHIFNANRCACYTVTCVEPSCQYHIYSVLATLLGLLLRDMGMHGADNPERNNPSWLAGWLPGFGRHTWIPGPVIKASLVLPCLRSCAANRAIAKEPNCFQKHACPLQGCWLQPAWIPALLTYPDCSSSFLLLSPWSQQPSHQDTHGPRRWWPNHWCPLGPRPHRTQLSRNIP